MRKPTPWVWLVFLLSMGIFSVSMLTLREGRRFCSRVLHPQEVRIVAAALAVLERSPNGQDAKLLKRMLGERRLLAMGSNSFSRVEERGTFGYTDEHGRILLNPNVCFANQRMCAPRVPDSADVAATMSTLYHESRHLFHRASEAVAYEEEWQFVRDTGVWANATQQTELAMNLQEWEEEMPCRVELYVGKPILDEIRSRIDDAGAHTGS